MGYKFRQVLKRECSWMPKAYGLQYTSLTYSAPLPTFEKHTYPSYDDTDKKKALRYSKKIVDQVEEPMRLSLIRPCEIPGNEDYDELRAFEGMSPLTQGGFRTPDEPMSPMWQLPQFLIDL
jgi:hypothetical protein